MGSYFPKACLETLNS